MLNVLSILSIIGVIAYLCFYIKGKMNEDFNEKTKKIRYVIMAIIYLLVAANIVTMYM